MATSEYQFGSEMLHFSQADYKVSDSNMFEERFGDQFSEEYCNFDEHSTRTTHEEAKQFVASDDDDDLVHIFDGFVEEISDKGHELFSKLLYKVEKEPRFNKLKKFLGKLDSYEADDDDHPTNRDRGVNVDSSSTVDDIRVKLERFKVKTVNFGGVVKQETK